MKRLTLFTLLLVLFSNGIVAATTEVYLYNDPKPPGPKPLSVTYSSVTATANESDLAVYFDWSVGNATITVYNSANQIVDQEIVNTNTTNEIHIPINLWNNGVYTLSVTYGTTTFRDTFEIL